MTERGKEMPTSFEQFKQVLMVFNKDLGIVGHAQDSPVSPFEEPKEVGNYNLTQLPEDMTEAEFLAKLDGVEQIVVSCMDRRVARPVWEQLDGAKGKTLFLSMAGGPVQNKARVEAIEKIAYYLSVMGSIKKVVLVGHDHLCGAVKYFLGGESLPDKLEVLPGDPKEQAVMKQLIVDGACLWVNAFGEDKVSAYLAEVNESEETVQLTPIDLEKTKPQSVENL